MDKPAPVPCCTGRTARAAKHVRLGIRANLAVRGEQANVCGAFERRPDIALCSNFCARRLDILGGVADEPRPVGAH